MRLLLSYVPFKENREDTEEEKAYSAGSPKASAAVGPTKEGLFDASAHNFFSRRSNMDEINSFVSHIFEKEKKMDYKRFSQINEKESSEMFTGIMRCLHEKLPCSKNFFNMKRRYRR